MYWQISVMTVNCTSKTSLYLAIFPVNFQHWIRPYNTQVVVLGVLFPLWICHEVRTVALKRNWYTGSTKQQLRNAILTKLSRERNNPTRGLLSLRGRIRGFLVFEHLAGLQFLFQNRSFFWRTAVSEPLALERKTVETKWMNKSESLY